MFVFLLQLKNNFHVLITLVCTLVIHLILGVCAVLKLSITQKVLGDARPIITLELLPRAGRRRRL